MKMPLHQRILIGGVLGAGAGVAAHVFLGGDARLDTFVRLVTQPVGRIFLNLLFLLVIPLLFSALVLGVAGMGDPRALGRVGLKTLAYTVAVSAIAVLIGVTLVNVLRPGDGISPELRARLTEGAGERAAAVTGGAAPKTGIDLLVQIVPQNPIRAAADGDMLGVMFFSLFMGIGLALTPTAAAERFREAVEGLYDITMRLIGIVILLAPIGIAALLFTLTAQLGYEILQQLAYY
ncbi:MAG TPA: cation:dicarboxylase symporter family transporter, partial [Thermoanaerobaculia bacterium]|nr:cation:dicarboxylase symporter family transporter [Thermoanaerobaculia bacterium]